MLFDIPLRCRCGHMSGVAREVGPSSGFRLVCYCKDCQAFAHFLAHVPEKWPPVFRQGHAPIRSADVLDGAGGTDIFQMPPGRVELTAGADALRCLRFSQTVFRWYADWCKTPIANTASSPRFPVIGLIHSFMDLEDSVRSRDEMIGPPLCRIHERSAIAPLPVDAPPPASLGIFAYRAAKALGWWLRGLGRPNPFFDERTGVPLSAPRLVTPNERAALSGNADAAAVDRRDIN